MKKYITLILISFLSIGAFAQTNNLIFFNQSGYPFYVIMNGLRMNEAPLTNLRLTEITPSNYKVKVVFEDINLGEVDKTIFLEPDYEVSMEVKQNKKGAWVLRMISAVPINQAPPAPRGQTVIVYGSPAVGTTSSTTVVEETTVTTNGLGSSTTVVESGDNLDVNMNVGGIGVDMNVNVGGNVSTSTGMGSTTTTTTTTTTTGYAEPMPTGGTVVMEGDPCYPMNPNDFQGAKSSIASKSFSDSKMTMAKQITKTNCMLAHQVKEIMEVFDFESDRLEYAKFAYPYCADQNNYYKVNDAFEFESSIDDLSESIGQ